MRDARIADMQRQLQVAQEHLQERQQALDRMEASVSDSSELGEQVLRLQSGMSQLEEAREAALQEAAAATAELQKVLPPAARAPPRRLHSLLHVVRSEVVLVHVTVHWFESVRCKLTMARLHAGRSRGGNRALHTG